MNESYLNSVSNTVLSSKPSTTIRLLLMVLFVSFFANVASAQTCDASSGTVGSNTANICVGVTESFWSNGWGGGVWSSSNSAVLKVEQNGGNAIATGISAGTADVIYTVKQSGCPDKVSKKTITVSNALGTTGSISGITPQCSGTANQVFSILSVPNATKYVWTVPSGWIITSGQNTNSITVTTSSNSGNLTVTVSNDCKTNNTEYKHVNITSNKTPTPIITASGTTSFCAGNSVVLTSSPQDNYLWSNGATTRSITVTSSGNYSVKTTKEGYYCPSDASNSIQVTVNPTLSAPTIGTITQPTCSTSTGSFTISNYNPSYGYTISPSTGVSRSGSVVTAPAGTYTILATLSGCSSSTAGFTINASTIAIWNGTSWTNGPPTASQVLQFSGDYSSSGDLTACSCIVTGGKKVTINSGHSLTITNEIKVLGAGSLTFENNASLIQINNVENSGDIIYKRTTSSVLTADYTYWSSPVASQNLSISPSYASGLFYSYDDFATPEDWKEETASTVMVVGKGYIIRGPQISGPPTPPALYDAIFTGIPNNGTKTIAIGSTGTSNLLGNPYPSAINADAFLTTNSTLIEGTIYFWTHNTAIQLASDIAGGKAGSGVYAYTSDDYASYNVTGGVGTGTGNFVNGVEETLNKPTGKIAAGQAFFTTSLGAGTVTFNNDMRVSVNNTQFFKTKGPKTKTTNTIEKHRVWLNMTNKKGAFKQALVGYVTDATNDYDSRFDGESFDANEFIDFYSINQDKNLVIQGRALPFDENDEVPLGYRTTIDGDFTVNIDQVDGTLAHQAVFLEDKLTNTVFDLKSGNYTFNTSAGTFNERFVLRYTNKTLGTGEFDTAINQVVVSVKNKQIKINSFAESIDKVVIYDLSGRQIYQKSKVDNSELLINDFVLSHQTLIIKTSLQNGKIVTDKIIY